MTSLLSQVWAIEPRLAPVLLAVFERHLRGESWTEPVARMRPASESAPAPAGVAVIPIYGVLAHHAALVRRVSEPRGTDVEDIDAQLLAAASDPTVRSIVLDIDSPGGSVAGIPEVAATIRQIRRDKPVIAVANTLAASAAYWLGSQAYRLYATPSAMVGGIGVYAVHEDHSQALEREGVRLTFVSAGPRKLDGHPARPMDDETLARWQAKVDGVYEQFLADVSVGRGVPIETVREQFGQGDTLLAGEAEAVRMIDGVRTLRSVLQAEVAHAAAVADEWRTRRARLDRQRVS